MLLGFNLPVIPLIFPVGEIFLHDFQSSNPSVQTLAIQDTQFDFSHTKPAAVFEPVRFFLSLRCTAEVNPSFL
jgi:hypothetical protein